MNSRFRLAASVAVGLLVMPCLAANKPKVLPTPNPVTDLTVVPMRYAVKCPLPKLGLCIIRKPVDTGYRILTPGLDLDDRGDQWIADFSKADARSKLPIRVLGRNGDLHEIEVSFQNGTGTRSNGNTK